MSTDLRALTQLMHRYGFPEFEQLLNRAYLKASKDIKPFNQTASEFYTQAALAIESNGLDPYPLEGKFERFQIGKHEIRVSGLRIEIKMDYKPNHDTRTKLKDLGFYWVANSGCWTQSYNEKTDSEEFKKRLASVLDNASKDDDDKTVTDEDRKKIAYYTGDET